MDFASDNVMGASAPVLEALLRANAGPMPAYGNDEVTARAKAQLARVFDCEPAIFFVTTGTAANALALSAAVPPWGLCICHEEAHVIDDECGAPEFFMHGAKLKGLPGIGGKLAPGAVAEYVEGLPKAPKQMPPKALSISQVSECGLVYDLREIEALATVCRDHGLHLHMDGARFANALVALGCTPAEMTWKRGVDVLSFGATKNGCLMAEAIVVFNPAMAEAMEYRTKRAGQVISKGRLIAAQMEGYLAQDHWLANARHANAMATRLSEGLVKEGIRMGWPTQANEVFVIVPRNVQTALQDAGAKFHPWTQISLPPEETVGPDEELIRLVTSFATREEQVDAFLECALGASSRQAAE